MNIAFDAELKIYEKTYALFKKNSGKVKPAEIDALGYTSKDGDIYIQENNCYIEKLKPSQKRKFRCGVFTHELMHQIFTNFSAAEKRLIKLKSRAEKEIFANLNNILEDPAIEKFAPAVIGGRYIKALKYTILKVYQNSPDINQSDCAFSQFANALIQFGDIGLIKGEFTFPEAKECFKKVAPKFYEGINEVNPFKRLEIVNFIFETSRPLWEAMNEQQRNSFKELLDNLGKNISKGSGEGKEGIIIITPGEDGEPSSDTVKDDLRKNTIIVLGLSKKNDSNDSDDKKENSNENNNLSSEDENSQSDDSTSESESGNNSANSQDNNSLPLSKEEIQNKLSSLESDTQESADEEKDISDEIEKEVSKIKKAEIEKNNENELSNEPIESKKYGKQSVQNKYPDKGDLNSYTKVLSRYKSKINATANKFKQIFEFDKDEKIHKNSGKVNLIRANNASLTSRVFDKNYVSANFSDTSVMILVDESGSMSGNRIKNARMCAIALAEIFAKINMPIYILGFTADMGANLNHVHYITWNKNTKNNRVSLTNISAKSNNRDGMSIRYATGLLEKRQSNHKLMIVISDGQPLAYGYNDQYAVDDTRKAVDEARKKNIRILGVAIGNDINELHSIYKKDFLIVENIEFMFNEITKKLKKIFKGED